MRRLKSIVIVFFIFVNITTTFAQEVKLDTDPKSNTKKQKILTIESKVSGSQEQPKVLYIMPWQGISNPILIENKEMKLLLPQFKPIHPATFKQEVRNFSVSQIKKQQTKQ